MPSINYRISLEGGQQVKQELLSIEVAVKRLQGAAKTGTGADTFASTTAAISTLGSTAKEALGAAAAAAQKFGASSNELARVEGIINAFATRARQGTSSFAVLAQNYDKARASAGGLGQAAASVGSGLGQAGAAAAQTEAATSRLTTALGLTRTQFGMLGQALTVGGLGGLGATVSSMGALSIGFGTVAASIAALVAAGAGLTKFALDAAQVAEGLSKLSDVSGVAFSQLSELQSVFRLGGVSAAEFSQEFTALAAKYGPASQEMERANLAVRESHLSLAQAQQQGLQIAQQLIDLELQAAQREQQGKQAAVQTDQLNQQADAVALQLKFLPQIQALEQQRLATTTAQAENQLQMLELQDKFARGEISSREFAQQRKRIEKEARQLQMEALKQQIQEAKLRKQMIQEEQRQRVQQLRQQQQQIGLQREGLALQSRQAEAAEGAAKNQEKGLELQKETNKLAIDRAKLDTQREERNEKLTKLEQQGAEALKGGVAGMADFADAFSRLSAEDQFDLAKRMGLSDKTVKLLKDGGGAIREQAKLVKDLGLALDETDRTNLKKFGENWDKMTGTAGTAMDKLGAKFAGVFSPDKPIGEKLTSGPVPGLVGLLGPIGQLGAALLRLGGTYGPMIRQGLGSAFDWVKQKVGEAAQAVVDFAGSLTSDIWNAITTGATNAWDWVKQKVGEAKQAVLDFVGSIPSDIWNAITTGATNAWDWVKQKVAEAKQAVVDFAGSLPSDIWNAITTGATNAWDWVKQKVAEAKQAVLDFAAALFMNIWQGVVDGATDAWEFIRNEAARTKNYVVDLFSTSVDCWGWLVETFSDALEKIKNKASEIWNWLKGLFAPAATQGAPTPARPPPDVIPNPDLAHGGLLGGRGTGMSDSNLAWVSRGEHIMPARAVAQPGVLAFLEALRRSGGDLSRVLDGMGRFALGGMVPRAIPAFATGGLAGGMSNVTIQFPGLPAISGLRASSNVVDELQRAAALAQVRSGGRKPSRYS